MSDSQSSSNCCSDSNNCMLFEKTPKQKCLSQREETIKITHQRVEGNRYDILSALRERTAEKGMSCEFTTELGVTIINWGGIAKRERRDTMIQARFRGKSLDELKPGCQSFLSGYGFSDPIIQTLICTPKKPKDVAKQFKTED